MWLLGRGFSISLETLEVYYYTPEESRWGHHILAF